MVEVPTYEVIEFLDWLSYHNQKNALYERNEKQIEQLAIRYLEESSQYINPIKFLLNTFQACKSLQEGNIKDQMRHFVECGKCIHNNNSLQFSRIPLHPLLKQFINYLKDFHDSKYSYHQFDDRYKYYKFRSNRWNYDDFYSLFSKALEDYGEFLLHSFNEFLEYERINEGLVEDYLIYKANLPERFYRDNHIDIEIDIERNGITIEAERLTRTLLKTIEEDSEKVMHKMLYLRFDKIEVLDFFDWIIRYSPQLNLTGDIPSDKLTDLLENFCKQRKDVDYIRLKKDVFSLFTDNYDRSLLRRINDWFWQKDISTLNKENPFQRYKNVPFHGIFLYPSFGEGNLDNFINTHWQDLNILTGEYMDVYYSKEDLEKRNGFAVLDRFKSLNNIKLDDLPAIILWKENAENAFSIPLSDISDSQRLKVIQCIVQSIKENKSIEEIKDSAIKLVNGMIMLSTTGSNIVMGNEYKTEIKNSQGFAIGEENKISENTFNQQNNSIGDIDFEKLKNQLLQLRESLTQNATTTEQYIAIGEVANAEKAAEEKNGNKVVRHLKAAGGWVLETAKDIGVDIVTDLIKKQLVP